MSKLMPHLDDRSRKTLNLTVLQRIDACIEEILFTAAHVTLYDFNGDLNQWLLWSYFYTINRNWNTLLKNRMRLHMDGKFLRMLPSISMPVISLYSATDKAAPLLSCLASALMAVMIKFLDFIGFGSAGLISDGVNQDIASRVFPF